MDPLDDAYKCGGCGHEFDSASEQFPYCNKCSYPWPAQMKVNPHIPAGWQCPRCNTVWSPEVKKCERCTE